MEKVILSIVVFSAVAGYVRAGNCTVLGNGVFEAGCRSYLVCSGGGSNIVECPAQQVFNNATSNCDDPANVARPCGQMIDCSSQSDGRYADKDNNCLSWYTCTVFDEGLATCNWANAVAPPCGTMSG
ncbi:hypothetical protein MAR_009591 [Mya arenaria]|uniref:Chitin-binding type-2 domain-containing protein n=1 Tax=Mya arenaria TaxID=6604 RepID=A0ABY7DZ84_MYAAR|nr:hypothetical protein MAR_009591 [Mya arenaria]